MKYDKGTGTECYRRNKQLMNESEEVLAHFLEENGITPNELCPLSDIHLLHCWKEEA